jgi:hypothetical protein
MMRTRLILPALTLLLAVLATACQVRTTVTVDVAEDGSGTVEVAAGLDADAMARVPDLDGDGTSGPADLAALVRDEDLVAAGWTVTDPETDDGGTTWLRVSRPFGTPEEADQILATLTGTEGGLRDLHVSRTESFGRTELAFTGSADLSQGLEAFGDADLAAALDGEPLGEDAAAIEARLGRPLAEMLTLEVTASLAGESTTWTPRLGDAPVAVAADATVYDTPVLALAAVAVLCLAALVALLIVRAVRARQT